MNLWRRACRSARPQNLPSTRRWLSQATLDRLNEPVQSYISTSSDPYLNLSIEHYLLQKTAPESAVLFLYINRPSIIIGRNQNPWLEVNLRLLDAAANGRVETEPPGLGAVDLVRRRSGGGTVFHDQGNVNWTVICPSKIFTRDKHAEMVVRALRSCGIDRSRVNERHDIVLDQGPRLTDVDETDSHATPYMHRNPDGRPKPLKVSGSAYKLTRQRALHHGTCLLSNPNLNIIPDYLHSPAKPYITARGVESVSSPVGNILLSNERFIAEVQQQFATQYTGAPQAVAVGEDWRKHEPVRKGYDELRSLDWTYLQTPQFTLSNECELSHPLKVELTVRNGLLSGGSLGYRDGSAQTPELPGELIGTNVHEIKDWYEILQQMGEKGDHGNRGELAKWLQRMLPVPKKTVS